MYEHNVLRRMQLAVSMIFLMTFNVEAISQSGCANFFQLTPLPLCDGTSQVPGVNSGGVSSGGAIAPTVVKPPAKPDAKAPTPILRRLRHKRDANFFAVKKGDDLIFKTTEASEAVAGGDGVCGNYDTNVVLGVCLWSGIDETGKDPNKSGWISGSATTNCGREVEVWRASTPDKKITAKVVDGCGLKAKAFKVGCENLFLTKKLLTTLDPAAVGEISDLKWQFKKLKTIF
ncbi:hypothetical protein MJO28_005654 [Puccinia striiformis f. sp. tritici]|uniref:Uncharacterized protein n=4 Tax=Puccinia striiformis TaxID=27350 RepID=A0A0L0V4M5_9BASI|nr:hypothetical protein Pst134EA_009780 [Puccinia striiformis f. sp. tritici]KNE94255.1 hypothetical protein PSTG_12387 [Puccinia striiformis f. sp. tritici PST-78]POW06292.1 hypothetical protein PSTT_09159 [Puccinia striiformis]KAH9458599.1 hypothetical protein Pst134EB_010897 [Puccinia striiformis f. sp. tritici]KAH9469259.1 hypothetical protein Pst134EA_009780 [Puccinia striiformis f. sp. tritici]KAI7955254.1 hypothetical protein MJO28_005654 [Puccinia striiformis f. sp. tritici]